MASNELSIPNAMSTTPQSVQDEANTPSALSISTHQTQVAPPDLTQTEHCLMVQAPAVIGTRPSVLLHSLSSESAIRFTTTTNDKAFHVGLGGNAGAGTFFFFTTDAGVVAKITQNGDVRMEKNLTIVGQLSVGALDAGQTRLVNVPSATTVLKHLMIDPATGRLFMQ